jgi:hypothetical protein
MKEQGTKTFDILPPAAETPRPDPDLDAIDRALEKGAAGSGRQEWADLDLHVLDSRAPEAERPTWDEIHHPATPHSEPSPAPHAHEERIAASIASSSEAPAPMSWREKIWGKKKEAAPKAEKPEATAAEKAPAASPERPELEPYAKAIADKRSAYGEAYRKYEESHGRSRIERLKNKVFRDKDAASLKRALETSAPLPGDELRYQSDDETERNAVRERRSRFVAAFAENGLSDGEITALYERELRRVEYDAAKSEYKNKYIQSRYEEIAHDFKEKTGKLPKDLDEAEQAEFRGKMSGVRMELLQKLVMKEAEEVQKEKMRNADGLTRRVMMKALEGARLYGEMNKTWKGRVGRIAATTALFTGGALLTGYVAPAAVGVFAVNRFRKTLMMSAIGGPLTQVLNRGMEKMMSDPADLRDQKIAKLLEQTDLGQDVDLETMEEGYARISKEHRRALWNRAGMKAAVALAAGMGMGAALNWAEGGFETPVHAASAEDTSEGAPGVAQAPLEAPVPPPSGSASESLPRSGTVRLRIGEDVPAPPSRLASEAPIDTPRASVEAADLERLSEVRQGEGAWQAVYRQLEARLQEDPAHFGLDPEDLEDAAKVKAALNRATAAILTKEGFMGGGKEVRFSEAGAHVRLTDGDQLEFQGKTYDWEAPKASAEAPTEPAVPSAVPPPSPPGEVLDAAAKAEYAERLAKFKEENEALQAEIDKLGAYPDPEKMGDIVDRMKALKENVDLLRSEIGPQAVAEVGIGISPEKAVEHALNAKPAATLESFAETVMDRSQFPQALSHQLAEHMTGFTNLPSGYRREVATFLMHHLAADKGHKILPVNLDQISRTRVDFAPLFANKELMADALHFPREARVLENFGFHQAEYLSPEYLQVLRKVRVYDFMDEVKTHSRPGEIMEFTKYGQTAVIVPEDSYMKLAKAMSKFSPNEVGEMSVADFLKHYDSQK